MALKATYPDDGPGCLHVVPLFFRETNPQPRKHTSWQATDDFTGGQANLPRCHYLQYPPGLLGQHFEKLIQCDMRLRFLSQQAEVELESPYFVPVKSLKSVFDEPNEYDLSRGRPTIFDLHRTASSAGGQSSSSRIDLHYPSGRPVGFSWEAPSPSSVMDMSAIEGIRRAQAFQKTFHDGSTPSKVSSLRFLLQQKDPTTFQDLELKAGLNKHRPGCSSVDKVAVTEGTGMSRDDSIGDLLLNLPRIESLPQFFYNF